MANKPLKDQIARTEKKVQANPNDQAAAVRLAGLYAERDAGSGQGWGLDRK